MQTKENYMKILKEENYIIPHLPWYIYDKK